MRRARPASTSFPAAVRLGLEQLAADATPSGSGSSTTTPTPTPDALAALLAAAAADPDADVLGPKLREWPSLRRLLELGVTISGTGRRETGLERGEYDQGQHDEVRTVLAVNTAGMLVRRRVLEELGGFDDQLPIFGNDIDFGWRAAAAGHRTVVVPQAVVFHAEAAHRGRAAHAADRPAHALPGAPGRALHAAGQLPGPGAAAARWSGSGSARCCGCSASCWSARSARPSTSSPRWSRSTRSPRRDPAPPGGPAQSRRPADAARRRGACWRRGGCPTATASTSSATSPPR